MVKRLSGFVDMALDKEEKKEYVESFTSPSPPTYPYGLCISLTEKELEKLGIDEGELDRGDMLHVHALAKVTSVSSYDTEYNQGCRVELQLCYMKAEDEGEEDKKVDKTSKLYK